MKEKILKLKAEGKTYNEIKKILGCSKGTISYYCGENQKAKTTNRNKKRRENILLAKLDRFKFEKPNSNDKNNKFYKNRKDVVEATRKYQKRDNKIKGKVNKEIIKNFTWEDIIKKFGENTICYLSGEKINLFDNNYQLDHIIPVSKGGDNSLNNLGITHKIANIMKASLTVDEFINWCIKVLINNGYNVTKK